VSALRSTARRTTVLAVGSVITGLAATACAPVHPGAAAVVGNQRITVSQVQALAGRSLADPSFAASQAGSDRATVERNALSQLIDDQLLDDAARSSGVSVSQGDVSALRAQAVQQAGGLESLNAEAAHGGVATADLDTYFYYHQLVPKLRPKATVYQVDAAHILVKDKATADKILAEVKADPSQFASIAKNQSIDTGSAAKGGELGKQLAGGFVAPFAKAVDTEAVGTYFEVQTQFGYHVVHLESRTAVTLQNLYDAYTTASQNGDQAGAQQAQQAYEEAFTWYLQGVADQAGGVSVNPRYGAWDATSLQVVASDGALVSSAPAAASPNSVLQPSG
jgi:peptidyl-prolyl cis-trans isomerase C